MNMIIFSAIIVIVLFVTCFFKYRAAVQSTDRKPQTMNNKKKKHFIGFFTSEHFKDVIIQLCIVILGAYIALVYTNDHEYQQTMQRTYSEFRVAADDMETQSKLLNDDIARFGSNNVIALRQRAYIDTSLAEKVLFDDDIIVMLPNNAYTLILTYYHNIKNYNRYLASYYDLTDTELSMSSIISLQEASAHFAFELDQAQKYLAHTISDEQYKTEASQRVLQRLDELNMNPFK